MSTSSSISGLLSGLGGSGPTTKSYSFTSNGLGIGVYYSAGFYQAPAADANLNEGSPTAVLGVLNISYAAHAFLVAGGPGSASGGAGPVEIEVSGTSISDLGVRTPGDTEIIVADITALVLDQFLETTKKWIGQVTYTLQNAGGSTQTTFNADFNYGLDKYEDFGNRDFTITDFECVGLGGALDTVFNIRLLKQDTNGWTYDATGFVSGGTELLNMNTIHGVEHRAGNGWPFAFKVSGLSFAINGSNHEGLIVEVNSGSNNTVRIMNIHIGVEIT